MKRRYLVVLAMVGLALAACEDKSPPKEYEFICEDDGVMVERHVGVKRGKRRNNMFQLFYVEGTDAYYTPKPGETCQLERIQ